jgi:hypothetical protein
MMRKALRLVLFVLLSAFAGYVVWDQVESRRLARAIAEIEARGEPITIDDTPVGADTPERHDAARIYAAAAERERELPSEHTFRLWTIDVDSPTPPSIADLEAKYRPDAPILQLLDQAAPLDFNGFGDVEVGARNPLSIGALLADLRADLYAVNGKGDEAASSLVTAARTVRTSVDAYSRWVGLARLLGSVRILLRHASPGEAALARLQNAIAGLPDTDTVAEEVQRSRARMLDEWRDPRRTVSEAVVHRVLRPWIVRSQRAQLAATEAALAVAREPWPGKLAANKALEQRYAASIKELTRRRGVFARIANQYGGGIPIINVLPSGYELAARRVMVTTIAIERYRRAHAASLPPSLDALVPAYLPAVPIDPFSGAALVFKPSKEAYLVYSVDANGKDDGGALYGVGSKGQLSPRQGLPRDLGIRVEIGK